MKKIFYIGAIGIILFEFLKVYFIMPMPGSQQMRSIDVAYFLHTHRWEFRVFFGLLMLTGTISAFQSKRKWIPAAVLLLALAVIYLFNFNMTADSMFKQPQKLAFNTKDETKLKDSTLVIAVEHNGEAKAYPIRYLVYHHQVQDSIGGKQMIVTYCSVCRTGRVFEPVVNHRHETFRLVGMDHFNAMFEDASTGSWWRQANGEAIVGSLQGQQLPEVESTQITLGKWFQLYPKALVMQLDEASKDYYDSLGKYERGKSKGDLTRTDSLSWKDKSWVVGIAVDGKSKAYDWNVLKEKRIIHDKIAQKPIVLILADDNQSFAAFERSPDEEIFTLQHDTLSTSNKRYDITGRDLETLSLKLVKIQAYQEFWHSWKTFHPATEQYQ